MEKEIDNSIPITTYHKIIGGMGMRQIRFPYGKDCITASLSEEQLRGVLVSDLHSYVPSKSQIELVQDALNHPTALKN